MIKGKIENGLHPKIWVNISGKLAEKKFSALVDTGFDLDIALHRIEAAKLGLTIAEFVRIDYASGTGADEPVCLARVLWHGKWKDIKVALSNDEEPAIGTHLLQDSVVTLNFGKNMLTIEELMKLKRKR